MNKIQFRVAARTDAAGKYNPDAPLEGNEDNMFIDIDLSNGVQSVFRADRVEDLSDKGCLLVVADGMGGMNAGEVASEIAIKTVAEYFEPKHIRGKLFRDSRSRMRYLEDVVVAADAAIKADSRTNKEHEGMGSTIILAWLCDSEICLTWCGDSRAYLYRPGCGFWQVSKDHSYVQGLVDDGKITMDEAFDHPYGNIITRSLGDPEKKAKPDSVNFDVFEGDVFMLCSDGLSGVLRDHKTYINGERVDKENLEDIIAANRTSMAQCRDELFDAAQRNEWYDNVTVILCEIVKGNSQPTNLPKPIQNGADVDCSTSVQNPVQSKGMRGGKTSIRGKNLPLLLVLLLVLICAAGFVVWKYSNKGMPTNDQGFFDYCKNHETVQNYRSYVKNYPQGMYVELANNWIAQWVDDSIKASNALESGVEVKSSKNDNGSNDFKKKEEKKSDNSIDKIDAVQDQPTESINEVVENKSLVIDVESSGLTNDNPQTPAGFGGDNASADGSNSHAGLTPVDGSNSHAGLTPADGNSGLKPVVGKRNTPTKEAFPKTEEEAYARICKTSNLQDCYDYVESFGNNAQHIIEVRNLFIKLFTIKLKSCNTMEELNAFISEIDDVIVNKMNMDSKKVKYWNDQAEEQKKKLIPNGDSNRPK